MATVYEVELTEELDAFVKERIAAGDFPDANEVVRAGLELLENQIGQSRAYRERLVELAMVGVRELDAGKGIELKSREELREFIRQIGVDAKAHVEKNKQ